jgi:hypothetical protein
MNAFELIKKERQRQIDKYGYSDEHILKSIEDYSYGELADAAASYCLSIGVREDNDITPVGHNSPWFFPWDDQYFKSSPDDRIKELTKAAAMLVAEIDRLIADPS